MWSDEQRSLYEKLELIDQQKLAAKTSNSARLWDLLQTAWRDVSAFMTYKSEFYTQQSDDVWRYGYGQKASIYAHLPSIEEERDWIEKIYRQPNE